MKKLLLFLVITLLMSGVVSAQQLELKEVITRSARGIEGELPQKAKIAILNFNSPTKEFSEYVIEELTSELLEAGKVTVVDRQNLSSIMNEMKLQYSGYVSDESMVSIGKMIGAHSIISGTLTDMDTYYRFRIRIINVETAVIQRQITSELKKDKQVAYLIGGAQAVRETERQQQEAEKKDRKANVRNNWILVSVYGLMALEVADYPYIGFGLQYERMLNANLSLGANFYYCFLEEEDKGTGIEGFFRVYPWGKTFFIGVALGNGTIAHGEYDHYDSSSQKSVYVSKEYSGLAITPELGWKVDFGNAGGFYFQGGLEATLLLGSSVFYPRWYLGLGYAF